MEAELKNILFLDIETVAGTSEYQQMSERLQAQWDKKANFLRSDDEQTSEELFEQKAGIFAEFGKIVVIGLGFFTFTEDKPQLRVKSLYNHDEKALLADFKGTVEKFDQGTLRLCGHNAKEFDFPYICRRMLINGIQLPPVLDIGGKKPWQVNHIDTMDMWKFGDYKNFTSLDLLATIFDVPSSKSDIDGSQVNEVYYKENNLEKIAEYCSRDVAVTAQVYMKLKGYSNIDNNNIIYT
ncbi:MAG: 3'-5' exonuclease [Bacteroidota bacterium]